MRKLLLPLLLLLPFSAFAEVSYTRLGTFQKWPPPVRMVYIVATVETLLYVLSDGPEVRQIEACLSGVTPEDLAAHIDGHITALKYPDFPAGQGPSMTDLVSGGLLNRCPQ